MKLAARNGSQFIQKWSEMVLSCGGFEENVSHSEHGDVLKVVEI